MTRRQMLASSAAFVSWAYGTKFSWGASGRDPRFVFVNLRGGMDGLSLLAPFGDPAYETIREGLIVPTQGENKGFQLDDMFVLNPNMPYLAKLWRQKEAILFHATASPYRERSHFDGQDVLESGQASAGHNRTGWLNRLLSEIPKGESLQGPGGLVLGASTPLIMRGPNKIINWMPPGFREVKNEMAEKVLAMYNHSDPVLARMVDEGLKMRSLIGSEKSLQSDIMTGMGEDVKGAAKKFKYLGVAAGKLLVSEDGPRIASMNLTGWDTHQAEGPISGRMARLLKALDGAIEGLHSQLAPVWKDTVIVIATEFGRTAKMNGTGGTDHGTATTAIALGGALKGGRVIADWPGLGQSSLYEGRDLKPTTDLRAILKGLLHEHLEVNKRILANTIFPDSSNVRSLAGLIRS